MGVTDDDPQRRTGRAGVRAGAGIAVPGEGVMPMWTLHHTIEIAAILALLASEVCWLGRKDREARQRVEGSKTIVGFVVGCGTSALFWLALAWLICGKMFTSQ